MPSIPVVSKGNQLSVDLDANAPIRDLFGAISRKGGFEPSKIVLLHGAVELRLPSYEEGKLAIFEGETRELVEATRSLASLSIDGSKPILCGELDEEWLEEVKWGAFGHAIYEADFKMHRELIVFNGE
mmetsp:Transcript_60603/g.112432  ORF Transcript_60603/g.112432 Transcript_60603/m.112432 type:complete len:128 (-) Transcript_60603:113-496(-)